MAIPKQTIKANCFWLLALLLCCVVESHAEKRLALIVGNSAYGKGNYLQNPVHDAEDVASKLTMLGFDVTTLTDVTLREMHDAVSEFSEKAKLYDVALFYYSGHGLQTKGQNYLMPVDAKLNSEADVKYACMALNLLLDKMEESACPMKIVVLDACRNNPFEKSWHRGINNQGLATVSPPKGTYITFSTAAGSVALDGSGRNSPYTTAFLETLDEPNLSLFDFFNEVGQKVLTGTGNEQDPWTNHNTMRGKFVFNTSYAKKSIAHTSTVSTMPSWMYEKGEHQYVGVSVPTSERATAKREAIVNALLKYIFFEGGINVRISCENKTENYEIRQYDAQSEMMTSCVILYQMDGFDIDVLQEYYNNNDECFLLCEIRGNAGTNNKIMVMRKMQADVSSAHAALDIALNYDGIYTRTSFEYSKNAFTSGCHHFSINNVDIAQKQVKYKDIKLTHDKTPYGFPVMNISGYGSIGLAELALFAQFPTLPDSVSVEVILYQETDAGFSYTVSHAQCKSECLSRPLPTTFVGIANGNLCVSIKDPYEDFINRPFKMSVYEENAPSDFKDVMYSEAVCNDTVHVNHMTNEGDAFLLRKSLSVYNALIESCTQYGTSEAYGSMSQDMRLSGTIRTEGKKTFRHYYPFFFLDGEHADLKQERFIKRQTSVISY